MKSEKKIVAEIMEHLRARGFWVMKVHGSGYQTAGIPDLLACRGGRFYAFEVKRPGGVVSRLQAKRMKELEESGAFVAAVTSIEDLASLPLTDDE